MNIEVAKVSVEKFGDSEEQILYAFDKAIGLFENVKRICKTAGLPESHVYGLKFLPTKDNPSATHFISEINYKTINHNDTLKLVFSIEYMTDRIVKNLYNVDLRSLSFKNLTELCLDPVFIEELAKDEKYKKLIDCYITDEILTTDEELPLLKTITHLFQKEHVKDTSQDILQKTLEVLKSDHVNAEERKYALSLLQKILVSKNHKFDGWKIKIIQDLPMKEITPYLSRESDTDLQYSAVLLITTMLGLCKGQKKLMLIKEIRDNKENIYEYIIKKQNLDKAMEHELYVLQTYMFSLYAEGLKAQINIHNNNLFTKDEFELSPQDFKRISILMDFDEHPSNKRMSVESVLSGQWDNSELSLNSIHTCISDENSSNRSSVEMISASLRKNRISDLKDDWMKICQLTLDCLRHYKMHHSNSFRQSQIEEYLYEPGIFVTSERVVQMLAKILHVGHSSPDTKGTFYQPLAFHCVPNCSPKTPFFWELFAMTMWLVSRTRREMKASTFEDYTKVMAILEKQIKMALKIKPLTLKSLKCELLHTTFYVVLKQIQKEKEQEFKKQIETHPCLLELKEDLKKQNEKFVYQQRMNCLLNGDMFPKILEKKLRGGNIFVKLGQNFKDIMVYNVEGAQNDKLEFQEKYKVDDITHVVIGKNCKHSNLCIGQPTLAFSIFVNNEEKIRFIAKDQLTATYWTDAFYLLTGKYKLSDEYTKELNELVEMDLRLKLIDLQNIDIPKLPPPIYPLPDEFDMTSTPLPSPRKSRKYIK